MATKLAAGVLPPDKAAVAPYLIFNQQLDAVITAFLTLLLWVIVFDMLRVCWRHYKGLPVPPSTESAYVKSNLATANSV